VIKFLEKRFDIDMPNISPWRRAMVGDLTAAFDFESEPDYSWPDLPDTSNYVREGDVECATLPDIVVPTEQSMPVQETGTRLSRALDYTFVVTGDVIDGNLVFKIDNTGGQGAPFVLFDKKNLATVDPKQYAVDGKKNVEHTVAVVGDDYEYYLFGPNGFVRSWTGSVKAPAAVSVYMEYDEASDMVAFVAAGDGSVDVVDNAYGRDKISVSGGETAKIDTSASGNWYDFTVGGQRFMGRMETGKDGMSDPAMASGVPGLWNKAETHPKLAAHLTTLKRVERTGAVKRGSEEVVHKDALFRVNNVDEEL
jgi:phospholipase C